MASVDLEPLLVSLIGWLLFLSVYATVWNEGVGHALVQGERLLPLTRFSVLAMGAYAAVRATLLVALILLLLYSVMSTVQCMLPFVEYLMWVHTVGTWLCAERILFVSMQPKLLAFHAAVLLSSLALAVVYSIVYVSDADLADPDRSRSVVVRETLGMAATSIAAYAGLALFLIVSQITLKKGMTSTTP